MSAGITSACLPTIGPGLRFIAKKLGIRGSMFGLLTRTGSTEQSRSGASNISIGAVDIGTKSGSAKAQEHAKRSSQGPFYRLPENGQLSADSNLRPEHGHTYTVTSFPGTNGESDSLSGDEIPLHGI